MNDQLDAIQINFDSDSLWILNIALAIIMFGVSLGITTEDFQRLFKKPKILLTGVFSQFILFPALTFLVLILPIFDWFINTSKAGLNVV